MQQKFITCIGGGNMAQAIVFGLLKQGYEPSRICVCDPNEEKRQLFAAHGVKTSTDNMAAVENAEVVLFAVKPQMIESVCQALHSGKSAVDFSKKLIISIAAGISISRLQFLLPSAQSFVRVMPNTPALVGEGMAGLFAPTQVSEADKQFAQELLSAVGKVCWLADEQQMHAVTAGSGSSPAYFFLLLEAMQNSLIQQGLDSEIARELVQQSMLGAAKIAQNQPHLTFEQLRLNVTSKGGTTAAAIACFQQHHFEQIIQQAMQACADRSVEMETLF